MPDEFFSAEQLTRLRRLWDNQQNLDEVVTFLTKTHLKLPLSEMEPSLAEEWVRFQVEVAFREKAFLVVEVAVKLLLNTHSSSLKPSTSAYLLNQLGVSLGYRGSFHKAINCYERQLQIAYDLDDHAMVALTLNNLALNHMYLGSIPKAQALLQDGLKQVQRLVDQRQRADLEGALRTNLAEMNWRTGLFEDALDELAQVDELIRSAGLDQVEELELVAEKNEIYVKAYISLGRIVEAYEVVAALGKMNFDDHSLFGLLHKLRAEGYYRWKAEGNHQAAVECFLETLETAIRVEAGEYIFVTQLFLASGIVDGIQAGTLDASTCIRMLDTTTQRVLLFAKLQNYPGILAETVLFRAKFFLATHQVMLAYHLLVEATRLIADHDLHHLNERYEAVKGEVVALMDDQPQSNDDLDLTSLKYYLEQLQSVLSS